MVTNFLHDFGRAVRQLRQEQGMTQADLAERLTVGRTSITNIEQGRQNPPLSMVPEIANALGVDIMRLLVLSLRGDKEAPAAAILQASVRDADLRQWAGKVIGDASTSDSSEEQHWQSSNVRRM